MTHSTSAPTRFARRLFAGLCIVLVLSVAIGVLRAPLARPALKHRFAADLDVRAAPGWPAAREHSRSAPDPVRAA